MRPRKRDRHLPPCVYHRHGAYYLVKGGKWERLGTELPAALAEYGRRHSEPSGGMPALITEALKARRGQISTSTWSQYQTAGRKLSSIFAEFAPEQVSPRDVVQVRQALAETPNMANRVLSVLRMVFDYALETGLVESNPAVGVRRYVEAKRPRLISAAEFAAIREHAVPRLQVIMDLLYMTGQRVRDVLAIRYADLTDEGIRFEQMKTKKRLIVRWTPELLAVVDRAKTLHGNVRALTLLHNRRGKVPDYRTTRDQWNKACTAAGVVDAHMQDLRAMSATAAAEQGTNATALLGHTSPTMTARYLRSKAVPVVDGPKDAQSIGQVSDVGQKR